MNEPRELDRSDARWIAKIVAKAMWAKMTITVNGDLRTMTEQEWGGRIRLLDDAIDAVIDHVPDRMKAMETSNDGEKGGERYYPTPQAFCDAYEKLEGMPRDACSPYWKVHGRNT